VFGRVGNAPSGVVDVEELSGRRSGSPDRNFGLSAFLGFDAFLDEGWYYMRHRWVKLVAWPVKVGRHEVDDILTVLSAVCLRVYEQRLLGQTVGRVRLLWIPVPERIFAERNWGELGVRADGADHDHLRYLTAARFLDQVGAHQKVRPIQRGGMVSIGADATHACRKVHDQIWT